MADIKNDPISLHLTLDIDNYEDGAFEILQQVRPHWCREKIHHKVFTNGITNKMLGYHHDNDETDTVLIRINGNKTEIFLDRANEVKSFKTLHNVGCAPNLYCIFDNGLSYEYIPGETITREEVRDPGIFKIIAREMARLHKVKQQDGICNVPVMSTLSRKFLHLRFSPNTPPGKGLNEYEGPMEEELQLELESLEDHLSKLDSPLVYCHNDLLLNNVIYNKRKNSIHFIDYEYTGMNHQAFDIGNHFCEFAGVDEVDYSLYPNRDLQLAWLREYLKHWNEDTGAEVTDLEVERLYVQVNQFSLAAHFMWGLWALVQAKYSSIDFDYIKYAQERLGEYYKQKDHFLSLKMP